MDRNFDLIVVGAGPGGYLPAIKAARMGKKVAVVEKGELGGTCLNRGCIPTKTLLHASHLYRQVQEAGAMGIEAAQLRISMERLMERKGQVVSSLRQGIAQQFQKHRIQLFQGAAMVMGPGLVRVEPVEGQAGSLNLEASHILVAAGAEPVLLPLPGMDLPGVVDSAAMLELGQLFSHLVIIGGGIIGMEFAQIYSDFGQKVTVLEAMDRVLPEMDREISQNMRMIMKKRGVDIHLGAMAKEICQAKEGRLSCAYMEKGQEMALEADCVLVAVGRRPNGEAVFSEECKKRLQLNKGQILVDSHFQTSLPGIYAAGDVVGGIQLAHAATAEGCHAVSWMFGEEPLEDLHVIPACVYTDPEIAITGMSPDQAKAAGIKAKTGKYIMSLNGKSQLSMEERGFIKILAEEATGKVLGAQLMCARATDMVGELSLAVAKGLTARDLARVVMAHPTFGEGIGEAAKELL